MTKNVALMWSVNPYLNYGPGRKRVGSVPAHKKHLDEHGAVYWRLVFKVGESRLNQFELPMNGYLYDTETHMVQHKARITELLANYKKRKAEYIPEWRAGERDDLFILLDRLEELHPAKATSEFLYAKTGKPLKGPPIGNYIQVLDPLF